MPLRGKPADLFPLVCNNEGTDPGVARGCGSPLSRHTDIAAAIRLCGGREGIGWLKHNLPG